MGPDSQGGLRCNRGGCPTNLSPPSGSRTGWATYCSHLFCGPCGKEAASQGVCLACQADLSVTGLHEPAKILRVNLAPTDQEKQLMLAGMQPSDILDVAKAGMEFFEHQRELEVKLMRARISKQGKVMEAARQFNEEVVNHYKSYVTKLELEKEDLKREISRNMLMQTHTQPGVGPQSLQLALQFSGQVANSPRIGDQQANHIAAFEPDVEEIELEELDEEDFAPPPATNSRREALQVRQLPGGNHGSFGGRSSSKLQVRLEKVDMRQWKLNQSGSFFSTGRSNQVASRPWVSDAQWQQGVRGAKRGQNMQEDHLHLRNGKKVRGRTLQDATSPMRLF